MIGDAEWFRSARRSGLCKKHCPGEHIAGDVVMTAVTRRGLTQQVIHSWPDEIGSDAAAALQLAPVGVPSA